MKGKIIKKEKVVKILASQAEWQKGNRRKLKETMPRGISKYYYGT